MPLQIVIVDPEQDRRGAVADALRQVGHSVLEHAAVLTVPAGSRPDVVVVHDALPAADSQALTGRTGPQAQRLVGVDRAIAAIGDVERIRLPELVLSGVRIDLAARTVFAPAEVLQLTEKEGALLGFLAARPGEIVSRAQLLVHVWGYRPDMRTRTVDNTVSRLRTKVERDPALPVHIHSVRGRGYRFEGDAVVESAAPPLPVPLRVLGRQAELAQIDALFGAGVRCLTLLGGGGHGKTTLVHEWLRSHPGTFVDITAARTVADVEALVRDAFGSPQPLTEVLATRTEPLVLDNVEQVADLAPTVAAWLATAPALTVLATSRVRLDLGEERVLEVGPLGEADAIALLLRTGRARRQSFAETASDLQHVRSLSVLLDRLPLALELAGARATTMSPRDLLDRLSRSLRTLRDPSRVTRHQTVEATVRWSWDLLPPTAQEGLARLSVFRGTFEVGSAEAVLDDDSVLDDLVDHSLVHHVSPVGGRARLAMFASVRSFAATQADALGLRDDATHRHAACFAARGAALSKIERGEEAWHAAARLRADRYDLLRASRNLHGDDRARALIALAPVLALWPPTDGEVAAIRQAADAASPKEECDLRFLTYSALTAAGRHVDEVLAEATRAWELATTLDDAERVTDTRACMGVALRRAGRIAEARVAFEASLAGAPPSPSPARAKALLYLGVFERMYGSLDSARPMLERALREAEAVYNPLLVAASRSMNATVAVMDGRYSAALFTSNQALAAFRARGLGRLVATELTTIGNAHLQLGALDAAAEAFSEARELARELAVTGMEGRLSGLLGETCLARGEPEEALVELERAVQLNVRTGQRLYEGLARAHSSWALRDLGRLDEAALEADHAATIGDELDAVRLQLASRQEQGRVAWLRGDLDSAEASLADAVGRGATADVVAEWALLAVLRDDLEAAQQRSRRALDAATTADERAFARATAAWVRGERPDLEALGAASSADLVATAAAFAGEGPGTGGRSRQVWLAVTYHAGRS